MQSNAVENRRRLNGLRPMPGGLTGAGRVLRQTSGTLRQTEGRRRPHNALTGRNVTPVEVLKPRGGMRGAIRRKIRRQVKHLRAMGEAAGTMRHAGSLENQTPGEALTPPSPIFARAAH
jgi:hypothetical protein